MIKSFTNPKNQITPITFVCSRRGSGIHQTKTITQQVIRIGEDPKSHLVISGTEGRRLIIENRVGKEIWALEYVNDAVVNRWYPRSDDTIHIGQIDVQLGFAKPVNIPADDELALIQLAGKLPSQPSTLDRCFTIMRQLGEDTLTITEGNEGIYRVQVGGRLDCEGIKGAPEDALQKTLSNLTLALKEKVDAMQAQVDALKGLL